jgi:hypothetical protein
MNLIGMCVWLLFGVCSCAARGGGAWELYLLAVELTHGCNFWVYVNESLDFDKQGEGVRRVRRE